MADQGGGAGTLLLIGGAVAAYFYWPQISAALGISTTVTATANPTPVVTVPAGAQMTNNSPTVNAAGAVAIGTQGCYQYNNLVSCPPGVSPPAPAAPINNCQPGFSVNGNGVCVPIVGWPSQAQINAAIASGGGVSSTGQLFYGTATVVSVLPAAGASGAQIIAQTQANSATTPRVPSPGLRGLSRIGNALPVTNQTLIDASHNPDTAAVVAGNPQALLTVPQWNYFYTQASGVIQDGPTHPSGEPGARVTAQTYHRIRQAAGLPVRLGTIRRSAPGAFPLGSIRVGPDRVPFVTPGNRTIYRVPGRGSVVSGLGVISSGGGNHRWSRSPFPRKADWRRAE